jgi:hypothetical protein
VHTAECSANHHQGEDSAMMCENVRQMSTRDGKRRRAVVESEGKAAVLILDIPLGTNQSILNSVVDYLNKSKTLPQVSSDKNLFHIQYKPEAMKHNFGENDMRWLRDEILAARRDIVNASFDKILFFAKAPLGAAAMVGSIFSNGQPLIYYQYENNTYTSWGPIEWR